LKCKSGWDPGIKYVIYFLFKLKEAISSPWRCRGLPLRMLRFTLDPLRITPNPWNLALQSQNISHEKWSFS
jgi:hypothetical protein